MAVALLDRLLATIAVPLPLVSCTALGALYSQLAVPFPIDAFWCLPRAPCYTACASRREESRGLAPAPAQAQLVTISIVSIAAKLDGPDVVENLTKFQVRRLCSARVTLRDYVISNLRAPHEEMIRKLNRRDRPCIPQYRIRRESARLRFRFTALHLLKL